MTPHLIVGDAKKFALESCVAQAYERISLRALGFFVIHVSGKRYGMYEKEATMLANSFDEVEARIGRRGTHLASFAEDGNPWQIARAFRAALYSSNGLEEAFGYSKSRLADLFNENRLVWAPDGDEAFDDGSYILQFDCRNSVRLLAFQFALGVGGDVVNLSEVRLDADEFYGILEEWRRRFLTFWIAAPKLSNSS